MEHARYTISILFSAGDGSAVTVGVDEDISCCSCYFVIL